MPAPTNVDQHHFHREPRSFEAVHGMEVHGSALRPPRELNTAPIIRGNTRLRAQLYLAGACWYEFANPSALPIVAG